MDMKIEKEGGDFNINSMKADLECGNYCMPFLTSANELPERLVSFANRYKSETKDSWLHFYLDDSKFECLWNNPESYLSTFRNVLGIIGPDYSVYRNMPPEIQRRNIYRNRAIVAWLNGLGIKVIPNIRWGDTNTYQLCCSGVKQGSMVAVSNHGCYSDAYDKRKFKEGFYFMIDSIHPSGLVVYGTLPDYIGEECKKAGINLKHFLSDFALSRRKECA